MPLTGIPCVCCGIHVDGVAGWNAHWPMCAPGQLGLDSPAVRDLELARKVKAGDIPGRVPDSYAEWWWPKARDVAAP